MKATFSYVIRGFKADRSFFRLRPIRCAVKSLKINFENSIHFSARHLTKLVEIIGRVNIINLDCNTINVYLTEQADICGFKTFKLSNDQR